MPPIRATLIAVLLAVPLGSPSQAQPVSPKALGPQVRVPTSHANVHMGPSSTTEVLVLVSRGTVLEEIGRDREWVQVRLRPDFRKTGMVMRWFKNEDRGWMHDSTVEVVKPAPSAALLVRAVRND